MRLSPPCHSEERSDEESSPVILIRVILSERSEPKDPLLPLRPPVILRSAATKNLFWRELPESNRRDTVMLTVPSATLKAPICGDVAAPVPSVPAVNATTPHDFAGELVLALLSVRRRKDAGTINTHGGNP